ncbi:MAG: 16S rRNA (cytosine(1402)-N(4))-methyltransferase RsmH [Candidatus Magasanikbacteria bacterium]|nr:16S rRNA (cytosine(1402)-N(4))-methyltransferase RsmH [Candidatus Magasanikbacteria bacterium]
MEHISVLREEVLHGLDPHAGDRIIDCTLGDGGHTSALLPRVGAVGRVLAIDLDKQNIDLFKKRYPETLSQVTPVQGNFSRLRDIALAHGFNSVQGILFDLGWSSRQFSESGRGFSFMADEPLDMRLDARQGETAADVLNNRSCEDLERIFREYGEEPRWREVAHAVKTRRNRHPFKTTGDLVEVVEGIIKRWGTLHPATRVFQALRIEVNHELENLQNALPQALELLAPCGRLAVISFHSLEDRLVKRFYKQCNGNIITKKPIMASRAEVLKNRRARSAKLRVIQK